MQIQMLFLPAELSLIKSRIEYAVDAAQLPWNSPSSCVMASSPDESNDSTLLALVAALSVNSVEVMVLVRDSLIERSTSSCSS